jgi:peptidoglycan/xylan/chitin deacetylase (PgdA/CDA1 family)
MRSSAAARLLLALLVGLAASLGATAQANGPGIVSFVFDDGFETDYSLALDVFREEGCPASTAVVTDWIGRPGYLSADEIRALAASGWEIMSHTASHPNLKRLDAGRIDEEYRRSIAALETLGARPRNLVYPYNQSSPVAREIASRYFRSARGGGKRLENSPPDLYYLSSFEIKSDPRPIEAAIDRAAATGSWIILYHHRIVQKLRVAESVGKFRKGGELEFEPSGARALFLPTIWNRIGRSLYLVPLSGSVELGDRVMDLSNGATARISGMGADQRELLRSLLRYTKEKHPGMLIATVDQALDALGAPGGPR